MGPLWFRAENSIFKIQNSKFLLLVVCLLLAGCAGNATPTTEPPAPTPTEVTAGGTVTAGATAPAEQPTAEATAEATQTGAGGTATEPAGTAATPGGGAASGVLRWSNEGVSELDTLDPPKMQASNSVMVGGLIYEGLVRFDSRLDIEPAGAEKWDVSADGKTYTFTIRKGLKFADGSPVTSEDFRYSLERALSKDFANGSANYYLNNIEGADAWIKGEGSGLTGVTAPDPNTLVIKIVKPGVYFLDQLTYIGGAVVPKKLIDQYKDSWSDHAWGTGPFMVKQWKHNQSLTLVPNPYYWKGQPQIAEIDMPFVQDAETAFQLYQTGQLDIMGSQQFPPGEMSTGEQLQGFKQVPQFFDVYAGFNNAKAPFDNVSMRRALAMAVDKTTIAEKVLGGTVEATDHIVPQGMPGYFDGLKPLAFDANAAKAELAKVSGAPSKVTLSYTQGQADFDKVAAALQQMWRENLGLDVELNGEEQAKFNDDLTAMANDPSKSNLEMYLSVWGADYPDPQNFLTQQLHTGVGNNNGHWSDPEFDSLTDKADVEHDQGQRWSLYNQAEQIAIDKVGWLPLYNGKGAILIRPTVKGITFTAQGLFADDWSQVTVGK